ncbi:putative transmembrane protein [Toxoplasma gondii GAB2-2007-GAL-DOM2]|uniref:Putative transmembrane protein n=1 Tax=Toxoplasma gondii GAB2-2007-GAL-DOM2 TaxID=1130820 RepID=A0A086KQE7_TOXGO|nr:putative transmembrane protein [Toxoplasma gondii GAB2-2007-GAL-DOM2]
MRSSDFSFPPVLSLVSSLFRLVSGVSHRVSLFLSLVCLLVLFFVILWPSSSFFSSLPSLLWLLSFSLFSPLFVSFPLSLRSFSSVSPFLFLCLSVCFSPFVHL